MKEYLIKSNKWTEERNFPTWWRPKSRGYTDNPDNAGRYTKEEAEYICSDLHGTSELVHESQIEEYRKEYTKRLKNKIFKALGIGKNFNDLKCRVLGALENSTPEQAKEILAQAYSCLLEQTKDFSEKLTVLAIEERDRIHKMNMKYDND